MAAFGSSVNPSLGNIDYSAIARGGQAAGQGLLAGAQGIANGIQSVGQDFGKAIQQYQQNKLLAGQAIGEFEASLGEHGPELLKAAQTNPEMAKAVQKLQKNGTLSLKDAAPLAVFAKTYGVAKQRAADAEMKQKNLAIDAYQAETGRMNADTNRYAAENRGGAADTAEMRNSRDIVNSELATGKIKPEQATTRYAQLLANSGRDPVDRPRVAGTYVKRDGSGGAITAVEKDGQIGTMDKDGKFTIMDPKEYMPSTTGDANVFIDPAQFEKLSKDVVEAENGIKAVNRFMGGMKDLPQGIDKATTRIAAAAKTIMGAPLSKDELAMGESKARQQRLLGALRTTVLGPGVLTEIDAQRILDAVGGDVSAITTNPDVVKAAMGEIMQDKMNGYDQLLGVYNAHVAGRYGQSGYKQRKRVEAGFDMSAPAAAPAQSAVPASGSVLVWDPATKSFKKQ